MTVVVFVLIIRLYSLVSFVRICCLLFQLVLVPRDIFNRLTLLTCQRHG